MASAPSAQRNAPGLGAGARDFSQPYYIPARDKPTTLSPPDTTTLLPAEFLQALPLIKGSPLTVEPSSATAPATTLSVRRQQDPP